MSKHALVTGTSRGIGNAIAARLLQEGFKVTGTSRKDLNPFEEHDYIHIPIELSSREEVEHKLKPVFESNDAPQAVINNAAIFAEADFQSEDDFWMHNYEHHLSVNLITPSLISKWAIQSWLKREQEGALINISSRAGSRGDTQEYAAYAATKGALVAFTKSIARSFGKQGITAYSISPGFVQTDMAIESMQVYGEDYLTKDLALNQIAPPEEIAELCLLLASGKLKHATGQNFHINSGSYLI